MSITLEIIRAGEFIRLDATEHLDFEASQHVLESLAFACRKRGIDRAMLDLRSLPERAKPHFTTSELATLLGAFRDAGFSRRQRLAILYRYDVHGGIRTFAFLSKMRGLQVRAFDDFEKALYWLSDGQEDVAGQHRGFQVPIAKRELKKRTENSRPETLRPIAIHAFRGTARGR